ncbi:MAG: HAD hydrolase-like protein [Candidatus Lokiarchaeota archaeon]
MDKFRHIIWDFDGTLFDTYPHITSVIQNVLKNEYNIDFSLENIHEWCLNELKFCFVRMEGKILL